ncbi:MAG: hypothetical protein NZQ09_16955, partial [Chloroflexus sp.]|nr:hypothetical protein [Chloroflexus sp.]
HSDGACAAAHDDVSGPAAGQCAGKAAVNRMHLATPGHNYRHKRESRLKQASLPITDDHLNEPHRVSSHGY